MVAIASGLADVDAVTLSAAQTMELDEVSPSTGWRMILVGAACNLKLKAGVVAAFGSTLVRNGVVVVFAVAVTAVVVWRPA